MTWRDDHLSYRDALAAATARGDRRALMALNADFDRFSMAVDDPTADARAEQAAVSWVNAVASADQLLAELVPDPRRAYQSQVAADPIFTPAKSQAILDARTAQGGPFVSTAQVQAGAGLNQLDLADLLRTGRAIDERSVPGQTVAVLLPMRIETRFFQTGADPQTWQLWLRLYPEAAFFDRQGGPPTQAEWDHTLVMWQAADGRLDTPQGRLAFQQLAEQHQGPRAAWLAATLPPHRDQPGGPITIPQIAVRPTDQRVFHRPTGLPKVLEVWLGRGGAPPTKVKELAVAADLIAQDIGLDQWGEVDGGLPLTWWLSFERAKAVGLGAIIDLDPAAGDIDVLYVIGLGDDMPDALFTAHRAAGALAVVPPGTPTNTVAGAPAADLGRDPDVWRRMAWESGLGQPAARELEVALTGGAATLAPLPGGEVDIRTPAETLVAALWPVLWGRALKDFLGVGAWSWELEWWASRCLYPEGPYPAIRIGDQPYGVLPVSSLRRWRHHQTEPVIETRMLDPLRLLLNRWVAAGEAAGTVLGADTEQFLDLVGRTPTNQWGWQRVFTEGLLDAWTMVHNQPGLTAFFRSFFDRDVLKELEDTFKLTPSRRYYGFGRATPLADGIFGSMDPRILLAAAPDKWPSSCPPIQRMLDSEVDQAKLWRMPDPDWWGQLGDQPEDPYPVQLLARLVRHALVLTRSEVVRRAADPNLPAELHLPSNGAGADLEKMLISPNEGMLMGLAASGPVGAAVARAWWTVRDAARDLCMQSPPRLDQALLAVLDAAGSRLDPWITGLATRRLRRLAADHVPFRLGAYAWVDQPRPFNQRHPGTSVLPAGPTPAGLLHAPSPTQALAAAILRDLGLRDPADPRWNMALDSRSIRAAARLAADVQAGIHLMEALGREVERIAGDPSLVLRLRELYPMRPEQKSRQVCDGERALAEALAGTLPGDLAPLAKDIIALQDVLNVYGDLLVADAAFLLATGRGEQAAEAMEGGAGLGPPPSLRMLHTERGGRAITTTVMAVLPTAGPPDGGSPASIADPVFAAFLVDALGSADTWTWQAGDLVVTLDQLKLTPIDTLVQAPVVLEAAVRGVAGADPAVAVTPGTAARLMGETARLAALVIGEGSLPDFLAADAPAALAELGARLDQLTANAKALVDRLRLGGPDAAAALVDAAAWGIVPDAGATDADQRAQDAADLLDDRLTAARPALLTVPVEPNAAQERLPEMRKAIRGLAVGSANLPVLCSVPGASLAGLLPAPIAGDNRPSIDPVWLEVVAAVRPPLARLDAHQLQMNPPWAAWSTHVNDPWCMAAAEPAEPPEGVSHQVRVAYGPPAVAVGGAASVGVALLDHWAETIPSRQHTTGAAFGFNAPKSRAPQSILIAIPPDLATPLDTPTLIDILAETRLLTRARMATPDSLADVGVSLPLPLLLGDERLNFSHAGSDLERATP